MNVSEATLLRLTPIGTDVAAVAVLAYGLFFRRYYRRDLLLAYLALNLGVLVVTAVLVPADVGVGLGFGLFGVLSIIRLRSDTITHEEIAYYFVALALGLLGGIPTTPRWLGPALSAMLVGLVYVVDHPRLFRQVQRQIITLDAAYLEEQQVRAALRRLLGTEARRVIVLDVDLVRDVTRVDVRYRAPR